MAALTLSALDSAGSAAAADDPHWVRDITLADIQAAYPPDALKAGVSAWVRADCDIDRTSGRLNCQINGVGPADKLSDDQQQAFRAATMKLFALVRAQTHLPPGVEPVPTPQTRIIGFLPPGVSPDTLFNRPRPVLKVPDVPKLKGGQASKSRPTSP